MIPELKVWTSTQVYPLFLFCQVSSQHPYAEQYIGRPHVMTVDYNNSEEFETAVREIMRMKVRSEGETVSKLQNGRKKNQAELNDWLAACW